MTKDFSSLSGAWQGFSVEYGVRITETFALIIDSERVSGLGYDKDGDFEVLGTYNRRTQRVSLTRQYTRTTEPSQQGVGIPYEYDGIWNGAFVSGTWFCRIASSHRGTFEMWPSREEDQEELRIEFSELCDVRP